MVEWVKYDVTTYICCDVAVFTVVYDADVRACVVTTVSPLDREVEAVYELEVRASYDLDISRSKRQGTIHKLQCRLHNVYI